MLLLLESRCWIAIVLLVHLTVFLAVDVAIAAIIDFETIPGNTPSEGLAITDQFDTSHGVSFQLENGGNPRLAQVGSPAVAFWGPPSDNGPDQPATGQNVDQFFLTDDQSVGGPPSALIIQHATPVNAASAVIIDIDGASTGQSVSGDEAWAIEARNDTGNVIQSILITAGDPGTGDGLAKQWSFNFGSAIIHSIRINYTGTKTTAVGLAFDNFSPSTPFIVNLKIQEVSGGISDLTWSPAGNYNLEFDTAPYFVTPLDSIVIGDTVTQYHYDTGSTATTGFFRLTPK